ncbi:hypothetical protein GCK32_014967 [Trichostrongylus colubriformis]|uniref:Uncharacterized protein n=1 Tax=Trichostrongylus colubriformis TaxID=6319 RepID=A0AAN8G4H2_TRICO
MVYTPPDANAQPRYRRRYAQGNRSKTIELGTLSEIEEDIYHNKEGNNSAVGQSAGGSQDDSAVDLRWPRKDTVKSIIRHLSERQKGEQGKFGNPFVPQYTEWIPPHYFDESSHLPSSTMSEFHASAASCSTRTHTTLPSQATSLARSESMLVPNNQPASLIGRRPSNLHVSHCPIPVWYPPPHVPYQPPPPLMYIPIGHPALPLPSKIFLGEKEPSLCVELCCGGVAQMLWTLICVVLLGVVGVLITALFYV